MFGGSDPEQCPFNPRNDRKRGIPRIEGWDGCINTPLHPETT